MADIRLNTAILDDFNYTENPISNGGKWVIVDTARDIGRTDGSQYRWDGSSSFACWDPLTFDGDDSQCWGYTKGGNSPAHAWGFGLVVASSIGGTNAADGYLFRMEISTGGGLCVMYRFTDMAFTTIASNTTNPPTGGEWLGLIMRNGNLVEFYASQDGGANWTNYISVSDTTYTTGLKPALHCFGSLLGFDYFGAGPGVEFIPQIYRRTHR